MLKRVFFLAAALGSSLVFAQTGPETAPSPEQQTAPMSTPLAAPEPENQNSGGVVDEIERALREKENAEAAAAARMPPSQLRTHRYEIAQSRGFQVVTDGTKYTLRRSDIESPSFYITKRYRIKNQPAEYLLQPIANFLGIKATPAGKNFPGYPQPSVSGVGQEISNSGATNTTITPTTSSTQTQPRYEPSLPFDAPLSNWGVCQGRPGRGIRRTE